MIIHPLTHFISAGNLWRVFKSVLAAFIGVQSQQNYEHDFTQSTSILPYVVVGIILVAAFVLTIIGILVWLT